jgi:signal transduction histidine kinase
MRLLRDVPIRRKLMLILMLTTGGALLLAGAGLLSLDYFRFRREMVTDLQSLAEIIAQNSTAALSFQDPRAAQETLAALSAKPSVLAASLYDVDKVVFATWARPGRPGRTARFPDRPGPDGALFQSDSLVLFSPVVLDGERIGTVYLESGLAEVWARLRLRAVTIFAVFLAAAGAALGFSSALQALISRPIVELADTAHAVSEHNDYTLRAEKRSEDELGRLVDAFNQMLAQIEERDTALLAAKEDLEHRVLERTRELQTANVELRQSNRELDDFAYIASHDLKEPLRGIHNYSMFLLEDYGGKLDEDGKDKLETLMRLTRRMEVLIDSLLQFSRLGRVDLAMEDVDLGAIVAEVLDSLGINLKEEDVEVRMPRPLPTVRADRARVGEIFYNLIVNAVRYNDKPRKWVEIGWLEEDPPVFYVRDNGIGIQEKHFDSIFRIFKRLHSREKFGGGTGAGLTIVKKIVERHSGRIWLDSTPGEGTTFYFTLAKGDSVAEDAEPADPAG